MKAERRHELQQNTLAQFLSDLPLYVRFHANKILVGVIVICLVFLLVRHRMSTAEVSRGLARQSLTDARNGIGQLEIIDQMHPDDLAKASERKKLIEQVRLAVDQILANTSDPEDSVVRAEAMVLRGDLLWAVANLPPLAGAATLPSTVAPPTTSESLDRAETAYREAVGAYPNQDIPKVTALMGLAAIEENRGNWDKAIEYYNQVKNDPALPDLYKQVAEARAEVIPTIRTPTYLGKFSSTQPATAPATNPAEPQSAAATSGPTTTNTQ